MIYQANYNLITCVLMTVFSNFSIILFMLIGLDSITAFRFCYDHNLKITQALSEDDDCSNSNNNSKSEVR